MITLIQAPESTRDVTYRVEMGADAATLTEISALQRGGDVSLPADLLRRIEGDIIEVSTPRKWDLKEFLPSQDAEPPIRMEALLAGWKIWLIEMGCSFIPAPNHSITWARFATRLSAPGSAEQPQVSDLFPLEVYDPIQRDETIGVSPSLKFSTAEASLGNYLLHIKYAKLDPKVIAVFGEARRLPTWNFSATRVCDVRGYKPLYLIVQIPDAASALRLEFALFAKTQVEWGVFPVTRKKTLVGGEWCVIAG